MARRWNNSKGKNTFVDKANKRSLDNLRKELGVEEPRRHNNKDRPKRKRRK